jgi:hypothetical protein
VTETPTNGKLLAMDLLPLQHLKRRFSIGEFVFLIFKLTLAFLFLPIFLIFKIFDQKEVLKVTKCALLLIYTIFLMVGFYTLLTGDKVISTGEKVVLSINYQDRIKELK